MPGVLTRWDPYGEFAELRNRFDRMFGDLSLGQRAQVDACD